MLISEWRTDVETKKAIMEVFKADLEFHQKEEKKNLAREFLDENGHPNSEELGDEELAEDLSFAESLVLNGVSPDREIWIAREREGEDAVRVAIIKEVHGIPQDFECQYKECLDISGAAQVIGGVINCRGDNCVIAPEFLADWERTREGGITLSELLVKWVPGATPCLKDCGDGSSPFSLTDESGSGSGSGSGTGQGSSTGGVGGIDKPDPRDSSGGSLPSPSRGNGGGGMAFIDAIEAALTGEVDDGNGEPGSGADEGLPSGPGDNEEAGSGSAPDNGEQPEEGPSTDLPAAVTSGQGEDLVGYIAVIEVTSNPETGEIAVTVWDVDPETGSYTGDSASITGLTENPDGSITSDDGAWHIDSGLGTYIGKLSDDGGEVTFEPAFEPSDDEPDEAGDPNANEGEEEEEEQDSDEEEEEGEEEDTEDEDTEEDTSDNGDTEQQEEDAGEGETEEAADEAAEETSEEEPEEDQCPPEIDNCSRAPKAQNEEECASRCGIDSYTWIYGQCICGEGDQSGGIKQPTPDGTQSGAGGNILQSGWGFIKSKLAPLIQTAEPEGEPDGVVAELVPESTPPTPRPRPE
jgi:hypothetical protein